MRRPLGPRPWLLAGFVAILAALVSTFAYVVVRSQADSRHQAEQRFANGANLTAALTSSLFSSSVGASQAAAAKAFGGKTVGGAALAALTKNPTLAYVTILDAQGKTLASTPGAPRPVLTATHVRRALAGLATLSDLRAPGGTARGSTLEWALPFDTRFGRRIELEGLQLQAISHFLDSYLSRAKGDADGHAFILDSSNHVISGVGIQTAVGGGVKSTAFTNQLAAHPQGTFGSRYYASSPVGGSTWRVVLTASTASLYPSFAGADSWVLYAVLAAFALAGLVAIVFFRRVLVNGRELGRVNAELADTNASLEARVAERTAAAEERARELARSNEELERFSSVASHDLQEPLRKIRMYGERLRGSLNGELPEEPAQDLERMEGAAARMQRLINDLLDFSRITHRGKEFEHVDLSTIADEVVSDLEARIVELDAQVDVGAMPELDADRTQMRQLMQNLIGNALKFHRDDVAPVVRVRSEVIAGAAPRFQGEAAPPDRCVITVEDNGIGFDEKHAERIFTAFERLHGRSAYEGTGIGLSIARKIAWRHGGDITAKGIPGEGATFTVTLPLTHANGHSQKADMWDRASQS